MSTRILLIRHGQTEWNSGSIFQGHLDSNLTAKGVAQAEAIGQRLAGMKTAALYSSDLGRARHTASLIAKFTNHAPAEDARFRERSLGVFEGLTREQAIQQFPQEYRHYTSGDPDYVVPGGESARGRFELGLSAFTELARKHAGHSVIVVSHGGLIQGMFRHVTGIGFQEARRFSLYNCAYNSFIAQEQDEWLLETWGDISHLQERIAVGEPGDAPAETASEFSFTP